MGRKKPQGKGAANTRESEDENEPQNDELKKSDEETKKGSGKPQPKGKKGKKQQDVDDFYTSLEDQQKTEEVKEEEPKAEPLKPQPKGKKGKKQQDVDDFYTSLEDQQKTEEVKEEPKPVQPKSQPKGKKGKKQQDVDDFYTSLEDQQKTEEVKEEAPKAEPLKPQPKGKKGKKQQDADDFYTSLEDQQKTEEVHEEQTVKPTENKKAKPQPKNVSAPTTAEDEEEAEKEKQKQYEDSLIAQLNNPNVKLNPAKKRVIETILARRQAEQKEKEREENEYQKQVEELKKRKEEEAILAEKKKQQREIEKERKKEMKKKKAEDEIKAKRERVLAQFGVNIPQKTTPIAEGEEAQTDQQKPVQKKRPMNLRQRKKMQTKTSQVIEETPEEKKEETDQQEEKVVSNWEDVEFDSPEQEEPTNEKETEKETETAIESIENIKSDDKEPMKNLRSPICCVLGHVDVGKTKLLDKLRHSDVQGGEAGGITQQIGATYFPVSVVQRLSKRLTEKVASFSFQVPGLLFIDTPGHESFSNLRQRGASLCDIAVLVVDIMHGLEKQTKESISILRKKKIPFIVALNKVDRLYGWKINNNSPFRDSFKQQNKDVQIEFEQRLKETIAAFAAEELNAEVYYRNRDARTYVSLVPVSAVTGEGIPDLLFVLVQLTQKTMAQKLLYVEEQLEASVLEVKVTEGLGTCIDVILVNGVLRDNDTICLCGMKGAIVTNIRALLTPQPLKELRLKSPYMRNKEVRAAMGLKIAANKLEDAVPGSQLVVVHEGDDVEQIKRDVQRELEGLLSRLDKQGVGVSVQASTLGSLEALLSFLKDNNVPVSALNIGPIYKRDIIRAGIMLEKPHTRRFALILAFDVPVNNEAQDLAKDLGVRIFCADVIYHLFEDFKRYIDKLDEEARAEAERAGECVWPCVLEILPQHIFMKRNPILLGCRVKQGELKLGTPLCVPSKNFINIGRVVSIEQNNRTVESAKEGVEVAVKIMPTTNDQIYMYERHFSFKDELFSRITSESLYAIKTQFGAKLAPEQINLLGWMKHEVFKI